MAASPSFSGNDPEDIDIRWELSQILPYRSVKREFMGGIRLPIARKRRFPPPRAAAGVREILKELI